MSSEKQICLVRAHTAGAPGGFQHPGLSQTSLGRAPVTVDVLRQQLLRAWRKPHTGLAVGSERGQGQAEQPYSSHEVTFSA